MRATTKPWNYNKRCYSHIQTAVCQIGNTSTTQSWITPEQRASSYHNSAQSGAARRRRTASQRRTRTKAAATTNWEGYKRICAINMHKSSLSKASACLSPVTSILGRADPEYRSDSNVPTAAPPAPSQHSNSFFVARVPLLKKTHTLGQKKLEVVKLYFDHHEFEITFLSWLF